MSVKRPLIAGLSVLAAAALSAGIGLDLTPTTTHTPTTTVTVDRACTTEDDPGPCFWDAEHQGNGKGRSFWVLADGTVAHVVDRATAWHMYVAAYGENNSCRADFDATYQGTRFIADLPDALQQELAEGRMQMDSEGFTEDPIMADYNGGSVIEVLGDGPITQVVVVGPYSGAC